MTAITLNAQAADKLAKAQAALAALGLTTAQAADLQQAADLVEDADDFVIADIEELVEFATDVRSYELREDRLEAIARAVAHLVQA